MRNYFDSQLKDNSRLFYIYLGRGDIYMGQATKTLPQVIKAKNQKPDFKLLYSYLDYAKADYEEAQAGPFAGVFRRKERVEELFDLLG